jgi:hypothetical protein
MPIAIKRAYEAARAEDGYRVLSILENSFSLSLPRTDFLPASNQQVFRFSYAEAAYPRAAANDVSPQS